VTAAIAVLRQAQGSGQGKCQYMWLKQLRFSRHPGRSAGLN